MGLFSVYIDVIIAIAIICIYFHLLSYHHGIGFIFIYYHIFLTHHIIATTPIHQIDIAIPISSRVDILLLLSITQNIILHLAKISIRQQ